MKLKEIHRTSTFAWSPSASLPLIATGSVAGALDESFSNESLLEIWAPDFLDRHEYDLGGSGQNGPQGVVKDNARFNRLAWGQGDASRPRGVIAAGMENGDLTLWDPTKIVEGSDDALILRNNTHTGPIRGLDFNPIQTNLLSSGAVNGEVYIWDLKDPSKPYSPTPGSRSTKLDEITSVAWNQQVQYVLAGASSTGYTVVWDLRGKREVVSLAYGGGAGTLAGQSGAGTGMAMGGRRGMSDIAWHPDNATRLVTASEDDSSPIIMVWDLRNARAPEKILTGHEKGVLSLSWCKQDADLLLSCGKDNRALCWNPQTSEIIGELPSADNWAFQVDWCPRNPDMLATAFFDGTIGIHSIQTTNEASAAAAAAASSANKNDGSDIFDAPGFARSSQPGSSTLSLKQPPKWLRRPASSSFGFGGQLISISNLPSAQGKNQSSVVHLRKVIGESGVIERARMLQAAVDGGSLTAFAEGKTSDGSESWKALLSLFRANSREELVTLLGFSKEEIAVKVAEAIQRLKSQRTTSISEDIETDITDAEPRESVVSFLEPEREPELEPTSDGEGEPSVEKTPSELSVSATSDATSGAMQEADGESTTTVPSLFGDDVPGTPQHGAGVDFFSTITQNHDSEQVVVPHTSYGVDSSVAATVGSRASSVTSETLKSNSFKIYPSDESELDRLLTQALVLGDFESAVSLCLATERFADAILLAVKGGKELLEKTQKAYFERQTGSFPYLRLFQSIVSNDLVDIVQNADLAEWKEIFIVLCTFASADEFPSLAEQLGSRLEFQYTLAETEGGEEKKAGFGYRKNATLTYLASGRLERLISIWAEEMEEEEKGLVGDEANESASRFAMHAHALQTFVEKVTVFRSAVNYVDAELSGGPQGSGSYKLASLYERYLEYADALASQGLVKEAARYLALVPEGYEGSGDAKEGRERLMRAAGQNFAPPVKTAIPAQAIPASTSAYPSYPSSYSVPSLHQEPSAAPSARPGQPQYATYNTPGQQQQQQAPAPVPGPYTPANATTTYAPATNAYAPAGNNAYAPAQQANTFNSLTQPPHLRQAPPPLPSQQQQAIPPPPRAGATPNPPQQHPHPPPTAASTFNIAPAAVNNSFNAGPPPAPAAPLKRGENGGWNDLPANLVARRGAGTPGPPGGKAAQAITSPFPNASPVQGQSPYVGGSPQPGQGQGGMQGPPPPRPGSVSQPPPPRGGQGAYPPPPGPGQGGQFAPPPPQGFQQPQQGLGFQGSPQQGFQGSPQQGFQGSPQQGGPPPPRQMTPSQYAQPARASPGPYGRPAPGQGQGPMRAMSPLGQQPSPYAPPQPQQGGGQYAPPQGQQGQYGPQGGQQQQQQFGQQGPGPYGPQGGQQGPGAQQPPLQNLPSRGSSAAPPAPPAKKGPPPPKYPPGDREHIPESDKPAFHILSEHLQRLRQTTPPQQKRHVDDLERRIGSLFDALNCETLSRPVVDQLLQLTAAMQSRDRPASLAIHMDLLTKGSQTDDIGLWMSGVKQLIMKL
ncbi:hypothetical protein BDV98DRAFT_608060 [Pterulicium gracile]|uniref:Protein transport protein SEC31 n=1 Tax=Pterulicium gracile TaxID=1884261 RepID=A0A5C3Q4N7_9AGAR|nr:hypothetical protein BDV98DRAFT_608060 [Pterula gracilis]